MIQARLTGWVVGGALLTLTGLASAATLTGTVNTSSVLNGAATSGIPVSLVCDWKIDYYYNDGTAGHLSSTGTSQTSEASCTTGSGGTCSLSAVIDTPAKCYNWSGQYTGYYPKVGDEKCWFPQSCKLQETYVSRHVYWKIPNGSGGWSVQQTTTSTTSVSSVTSSNWTAPMNLTITNLMPAVAARITLPSRTRTWDGVSRTRVGDANLFLSPDGVYDKPIVVADGIDPNDTRDHYDLFQSMPVVKLLLLYGMDVWFVNYSLGRESVREHVNELSLTLYNIEKYNNLGKINTLVGVSESGNVGRYALAQMEQAQKYSQTIGSFVDPYDGFTYTMTYDDDATRKAWGHHVRSFIAWDSPFGGTLDGAVALPHDLQFFMRRLMSMNTQDFVNLCAPHWGFFKTLIINFVKHATTIGYVLTAIGDGLINKKISTPVRDVLSVFLDMGPARDLMKLYCTGQSESTCVNTYRARFVNDMATFNQDGWPRNTRRLAFSQGTWANQNCAFPDQWGASTCNGPSGTYNIDDHSTDVIKPVATSVTMPTAHASPNLVGTRTTGQNYMTLQFGNLPLACQITQNFYTGPDDILGGSTTDLVSKALNAIVVPNIDLDINFHFLTNYQPTSSALNMTSMTSTTPFHDVIWQPSYTYTHQEIAPTTIRWMLRYVYEYNLGDGDGFPTCQGGDNNANLTNWFKHSVTGVAYDDYTPGKLYRTSTGAIATSGTQMSNYVGALCTCDPNDTTTGTVGTCNSQSNNLPALCQPKSCSQITVSSTGYYSDGCGGSIYCVYSGGGS